MALAQVDQLYDGQSVQDDNDPGQTGGILNLFFGWENDTLSHLLPSWGSAIRQRKLRQLFYDQDNTLVIGALNNLIDRVVQTPWELSGPVSTTKYFQGLFHDADGRRGFEEFLSKICQDYVTLDQGAFIEVVGPGTADTPLVERATGLVALDGLRCYPTGNSEYPVYYRSHRGGVLHKMHWTRVVRWVDRPSPDPEARGMGYSKLSRAAMASHMTMLLFKHHVTSLSDRPAQGFIVYKGVNKKTIQKQIQAYTRRGMSGEADFLQDLIELYPMDASMEADAKVIPFSERPGQDKFSEVMQTYVNLLALAIGEDPQEIWPLASSAMGSAMQSHILHMKGQGKAYGGILTGLERILNTAVLPRNMEFKWKRRDTELDKQQAESAQLWMGIADRAVANGSMSQDEARRLLANKVEAFSDVLLDEAGQLVRLPDDDPKETTSEDVTAPDDRTVQTSPGDDESGQKAQTAQEAVKAIQATRLDFEDAVENLFMAAIAGQMNRQRFGIRLRALIARFGRLAYQDGLEDGGVAAQDMTDEDRVEIAELTAEQSVYVTNVGDAIYQDNRVTEAEARGKPAMWFNKSIKPFYNAGRRSADRNGYYVFVFGNTEEHCNDCLRLNGQIHRLRDWLGNKRRMYPQSSALECNGFRCDCNLKPADGPARGKF